MSFSLLSSLLLSILLIATAKLNLDGPLNSALFRLLDPVLAPLASLAQQEREFVRFVSQLPTLARENEKLKADNNLLTIRAARLAEAVADRTLTASLATNRWQVRPVRLVNLGNRALFTALDFSGIQPGQALVTGVSLVGLVKVSSPPIITVTPLNSSDIRIAVKLETGDRGDYVFKNSIPRIINLPTNIAFNSKTTVLTLPTEFIPENLVIGQIDRITTNPAHPTQEANLTLDQDIGSGKNFFIITKP